MTTFKYPETQFLSDSVNMPGGSKYTCECIYKTKAGNYYINFEFMKKFTRMKMWINVPVNCLSNKAELIEKLNALTGDNWAFGDILVSTGDDGTKQFMYSITDNLCRREFNKAGVTNLKKLMTNLVDEDNFWAINETFIRGSMLNDLVTENEDAKYFILDELNSMTTLGPFRIKDFDICSRVSDLTEFDKDSVFTFTTSIFAKRDACQYEVNFSDGKKVFLKKHNCDHMFGYLEKVNNPVQEESGKPVNFEL